MALLASKSEREAQSKQRSRLFLLFCVGADRYALDTHEVAEVSSLRPLKQVLGSPVWVAGLLVYRGQTVPVIDLAARAGLHSAQHKTSTRLVFVHYQRHEHQTPALLGLILEQATDTLRCAPEDFHDYGLDNQDSRYLGAVLQHPQGLIQRITVAKLLPDDVHARLFPSTGEPS